VVVGQRVLVPLGRRGLVTGVVFACHEQAPEGYQAKYIEGLLDQHPILDEKALSLWKWIWTYYLCSPGDVLQAALPPTFKLQSETHLYLSPGWREKAEGAEPKDLKLLGFFDTDNKQSLGSIRDQVSSGEMTSIRKLIDMGVLISEEQVNDKYKPKLTPYILSNNSEAQWQTIFDALQRAPKQQDFLQVYLQESNGFNGDAVPLEKKGFLAKHGFSAAILKSLVEKDYLQLVDYQEDRVPGASSDGALPELSEEQGAVVEQIQLAFGNERPCLLHGVTGSGKTEIYIHLILNLIDQGKQALFLLPEIGLTTQLVKRLQAVFGEICIVFHSKYSANERHEAWEKVQNGEARIVVGTRSTLYLPYSNLGLVIVDEEHESSHKQNMKAPRIHARDTAFQLARIHGASFLMGTASPSMESLVGVSQKHFEYFRLTQRYSGVALPEIQTADLKEAHRKKKMKGLFTDMLFDAVEERLKAGKQVLFFQNRRGFAPVLVCEDCGNQQQCTDCDVNLTYHQKLGILRCHLCGNTYRYEGSCRVCSSHKMQFLGYGTEQIEKEAKKWFPKARVLRVDHDTTRGKKSFDNIIQTISKQECDIIVGTQMIAKGFDFKNLDLIAIINGDQFFNQSDFRASERAFHQVIQVSGRGGRKDKRGLAIIQTFQPYHPVFRMAMTMDFKGFYKQEVMVRKNHGYPPFVRFIKIEMAHVKRDVVEDMARVLGSELASAQFNYLGPSSPPVERVRNQYYRVVFVKLAKNSVLNQRKHQLSVLVRKVQAGSRFRSVRTILDVDP